MTDQPTTDVEPEAVHGWFGLTYANYLVLPRIAPRLERPHEDPR